MEPDISSPTQKDSISTFIKQNFYIWSRIETKEVAEKILKNLFLSTLIVAGLRAFLILLVVNGKIDGWIDFVIFGLLSLWLWKRKSIIPSVIIILISGISLFISITHKSSGIDWIFAGVILYIGVRGFQAADCFKTTKLTYLRGFLKGVIIDFMAFIFYSAIYSFFGYNSLTSIISETISFAIGLYYVRKYFNTRVWLVMACLFGLFLLPFLLGIIEKRRDANEPLTQSSGSSQPEATQSIPNVGQQTVPQSAPVSQSTLQQASQPPIGINKEALQQ